MRTTQIGWLKHGDIFSFEGFKYKVGTSLMELTDMLAAQILKLTKLKDYTLI